MYGDPHQNWINEKALYLVSKTFIFLNIHLMIQYLGKEKNRFFSWDHHHHKMPMENNHYLRLTPTTTTITSHRLIRMHVFCRHIKTWLTYLGYWQWGHLKEGELTISTLMMILRKKLLNLKNTNIFFET